MRRSPFPRSIYVAASVLAVCACSGDAPEVRDWTLTEDLRIGGSDDPAQALSRIGGVLAIPDGGVWVLQPVDRDIRVYGPDGALLRRVGRGGQEPGEFTLPNRMGWWGGSMDTVWVADLGLRRLNLFTAAGDFVTSHEMPFVQHEGVYAVNQPGTLLADGSALALAAYTPIVTEWEDFPLLRYDLTQARVLHELTRLERTATVMIRWRDRGLTTALHPISDAPLVAFSHDGTRVLIVERGTDDEQLGDVELLALGAAGDTLWTRAFRYQPEPLTQEEAEALMSPRIASLQQFARMEGSLSEEEAERAYRASVSMPSHRPPVHAVHFGLDGRIWMAWASAPGQPETWWVLDAEGRQVARWSVPEPIELRAAASGFVWAGETDRGVSYLVRYRVAEAYP